MGEFTSLMEVEEVMVIGRSHVFPTLLVYGVNYRATCPFPRKKISCVALVGQTHVVSMPSRWSLGHVAITTCRASPFITFILS